MKIVKLCPEVEHVNPEIKRSDVVKERKKESGGKQLMRAGEVRARCRNGDLSIRGGPPRGTANGPEPMRTSNPGCNRPNSKVM